MFSFSFSLPSSSSNKTVNQSPSTGLQLGLPVGHTAPAATHKRCNRWHNHRDFLHAHTQMPDIPESNCANEFKRKPTTQSAVLSVRPKNSLAEPCQQRLRIADFEQRASSGPRGSKGGAERRDNEINYGKGKLEEIKEGQKHEVDKMRFTQTK